MKKLLWLDDIRDPIENDGEWLVFSPISQPYSVTWVKSFENFVDYITRLGLPDAICFDHDLGGDEETSKLEKTGYDCAKWLVEYCMDNDLDIPRYNIQSANPVGKENINSLLQSYGRHRRK